MIDRDVRVADTHQLGLRLVSVCEAATDDPREIMLALVSALAYFGAAVIAMGGNREALVTLLRESLGRGLDQFSTLHETKQ